MRIIILLLCWFISSNSFSDPLSNLIPRVFIFHINGVNTKFEEALDNLNNLKAVANIKSNIIKWDLLYNETHGLLISDLWDVMKMKKHEGKNLTIHDYMLTYMKRNNLDYPTNSKEYNELKDRIKMKYIDDLDDNGRNFPQLIFELSDKTFHEIVAQRAYILLLPHSQGNLYANQLWKYFVNHPDKFYQIPKSHIAIFGIASPTDHMEGTVKPIPPTNQVSYYTADNDYVINSLSILTSLIPQTNPAMPGNMHLNNCEDFLCHRLIDSYLTDEQSRQLISTKINSFIITLKKNLLEEQLGENFDAINAMFWIDRKFSSESTLRGMNGESICVNGKCNEIINYLDTDLIKFDPYKDYKWSSNWPVGEEYRFLVPHHKLQSLIGPEKNDYFFFRGSLAYAVDSSNRGCSYAKRSRLGIEKSSTSPFYGKTYGAISTVIGNGCKLPDYMLTDNGTNVILGALLVNR